MAVVAHPILDRFFAIALVAMEVSVLVDGSSQMIPLARSERETTRTRVRPLGAWKAGSPACAMIRLTCTFGYISVFTARFGLCGLCHVWSGVGVGLGVGAGGWGGGVGLGVGGGWVRLGLGLGLGL